MRIKNRTLFSGLPVALCCLFLMCSPTARHKVLTTLFDGVPDSTAGRTASADTPAADSLTASENGQLSDTASPVRFYHPPYQEKECGSCHDMSQATHLVESPPELCYMCHDDFSEQYEYLHAPVEAGECTGCHSPHLAANPKLLTISGQQLCFSCHDSSDLLATETHAEIGETDCLDCHNPHGGEDEYLFN